MHAASYDFIVIGGGILGVSHAAAAAARGLRVCLLERSPEAVDSSVRNFGLLTRLYDDGGPWGARAHRSREIYESWAARGDIPLRVTGSLQLAQSAAQMAALRALTSTAPRSLGIELLDAASTRTRAPALAHDEELHGSAYFPNDALLEPREMFGPSFLPAALVRAGVDVCLRTAAVGIDKDGARGVRVRSSDGRTRTAHSVALCSGAETATLLPQVFAAERAALRLCKLQMTRVALPDAPSSRAAGGLPPPPIALTSGLSLKRYPALAAHAGAAAAATLRANDDARWVQEEALGIHIIARPATAPTRNPFGRAIERAPPHLSDTEMIVGDSHEYAGLDGVVLDETCDEKVTDAILRVAGGMLRGVRALAEARAGRGVSEGAARVVAQWSGIYLEHKSGVFMATARKVGRRWERNDADVTAPGAVHVVTGIGGKGMTMGPGLGEENIGKWFPQ